MLRSSSSELKKLLPHPTIKGYKDTYTLEEIIYILNKNFDKIELETEFKKTLLEFVKEKLRKNEWTIDDYKNFRTEICRIDDDKIKYAKDAVLELCELDSQERQDEFDKTEKASRGYEFHSFFENETQDIEYKEFRLCAELIGKMHSNLARKKNALMAATSDIDSVCVWLKALKKYASDEQDEFLDSFDEEFFFINDQTSCFYSIYKKFREKYIENIIYILVSTDIQQNRIEERRREDLSHTPKKVKEYKSGIDKNLGRWVNWKN